VRDNGGVKLAAEILVTAITVVTAVAMFALFVWGAIKDGEDERAFQRRLGRRRRTRLGP
jgi:hypothetical protein